MKNNGLLIAAGGASLIAAITHLAVIAGGPDWYRFFGAGEQMAQMAEQGSLYPALLTLAISAVLGIWGAYALSAARLIRRLPLLRTAMCLISFVYLFRGLYGLFIVAVNDYKFFEQVLERPVFMLVSSLICLAIGGLYSIGLARQWPYLRAN
ncbi:hypothetical protein KJY73_18120 [Bowmanella sp. Y26]|uniref:hypothetical protein n=1 Tax=Bowmanella yangjiangensis TaxID=2811230 RepID=UPI001BDD0DD7|nr:hypothetical protein [Bowmanella yangjiangensis]MBT1065509.1 hypothetical protein [Bowmanella yangjiangensis]